MSLASPGTSRTCAHPWCAEPFEVFAEDKELLTIFDVPEPVYCPQCRHQQRSTFQISLALYERTSALSGDHILTLYRPEKPYDVYSIEEWWSDAWDPLSYGREYDFARPFFTQFAELYAAVPKMATNNEGCENCEYCASAGQAKDCYYCRTVHRSERCYYSEMITGYNVSLCDCLLCQRSERLYECIQCTDCHDSAYLFRCAQTFDSYFSTDLRGCSNCLFCHNLRNASYCIENKPVSKEEFAKRKAQVLDGRRSTWKQNLLAFDTTYRETIWQNLNNINCEDCIGDGLVNSADCYQCFNCLNAHHARYCCILTPSEKCETTMDITLGGIGELLYNCAGIGGGNYFLRMCSQCRKCSEMTYCIDCFHSKNCFACTGLKSASYCILNKQYTQEDYEALRDKIVASLKQTGVWGAFFPPSIAPFPYNDSMGSVYFPLEKQQAIDQGFQWADTSVQPHHDTVRSAEIPDRIDDVTDDLCRKTLTCKESGRPFKIVRQELELYRTMRLPIPCLHPDVRMRRRSIFLPPFHLWDRTCQKCKKQIQTTYAPDRPEIVHCEECYLQQMY